MDGIRRIEAAIAALQAQRHVLGDEPAETALAPLRARLAELRAAQSLREVTILFLDVAGSTALSSGLDPEDIQGVVDGALATLTDVVDAYRGRVLQYAGDSLLAVFGADEAAEDDPERAVHCGLALLAAAAELARAARERFGVEAFGVRVGIHTGRVLLGGGVDAEHSIRGIAVNIAARMEQTAPVGGLRISHDTLRQVRGRFDVAEEPVLVKGVDQPLRSYRVLGARPHALRADTRGVEGVEVQMIGRDAELAQLQLAFATLAGGARLQARLVVADAGLGKSRLQREFCHWIRTQRASHALLLGQAWPSSQPYALLRDLLARWLRIADDDPVALARDRLVAGLAPLFDADGEAQAHLLGHLAGFDFSASPHLAGIAADAGQLRARAYGAAVRWLRRIAAVPAVMLLDDLHWADDATLDFLDHLVREAQDLPLLLVGFARPMLLERRRCEWRQIGLTPLSKAHSRALADGLLQRIDAPPSLLCELLIGGADGNPFYMEELLKMLIDDGAVQTGQARWRVVPERLLASRVPPTLTGVLQARLDALSERDRLLLQQASVVGVVFWDQTLAALADAPEPDASALASLHRRDLIRPQEASVFGGAREYRFKHQLLQQVAYDGVLKRQRVVWHARAADWIAAQTGERAAEHLGTAAEHFDRAGDARRASGHYARAADWAQIRGAHVQMLRYIDRGLALAPVEDLDLRWRLLAHRERFNVTSGDHAAHVADLGALEALAEARDDDALRADVLWRRAYALDDAGDFAAAVEVSRRCLALAVRGGAGQVAVRAYAGLGYELMRMGDYAGARQAVDAGLALARVRDYRGIESHLLTNAGGIARATGDHGAAREHFAAALAITRELGNRVNESTMLNNVADAALRVGDYAAAREHLVAAIEIARSTGVRATEALALQNLAAVAHGQCDHDAALGWAREALTMQRAMGQRHSEGISLNVIGHAAAALGRDEEANAAYREARGLFAALGDAPLEMEALAGLARVALARGELDAALGEVDRLLEHRAARGGFDGAEEPLRIALTCWQVLYAAGDPRAAGVITAAHAELQAQAARIGDARLRESLLLEVPPHREIVEAFARTAA